MGITAVISQHFHLDLSDSTTAHYYRSALIFILCWWYILVVSFDNPLLWLQCTCKSSQDITGITIHKTLSLWSTQLVLSTIINQLIILVKYCISLIRCYALDGSHHPHSSCIKNLNHYHRLVNTVPICKVCNLNLNQTAL